VNRWWLTNLRSRLTLWYVGVLAALLVIYAVLVFSFQYAVLTKQIVHDEVQDVVTVEGLLFFDMAGKLQLRQDYFSRPQSHLLVDRLMEVRDRSSGAVLYRTPTLKGMSLGGPLKPDEGEAHPNERLIRLQDGTYVLLISHIHGMNGHQLIIRLGYSMAPLRARMFQFLLVLLIAIPVALLIAGAAGQAIAKRALSPVEEMARRAEGITARNLHDRLSISNPDDELGQLASAFNHLLDRLEQSFEQLKRFTADAAHELRTPIAAMRTIGEVALEDNEENVCYKEILSSILEETARLNETIDALLLLARAEATQGGRETQSWSLKSVVNEVLGLLEVLSDEKGIRVVQEGLSVSNDSIRADRGLLRTAILNILHNAIKFSPHHGVIRVGYEHLATSGNKIQLYVQDEGPGIADGEHERVFERFYTSNSRETATFSGTGLGLSVAKLVIERLGGSIHFENGLAVGARCRIELPLSRDGNRINTWPA
jgi:signal transduction histidine kinase